jgi:ribosome-interacting GTPase 1
MPRHLLSLVRKADGVLLIADMSADSCLEDIDAVFDAFNERHVQFVREKNQENRDEILCRIIANKMDAVGASDRFELLNEMVKDKFEITPLSCKKEYEVEKMPENLFQWLRIVRVYTKAPGKKADKVRPYTVFTGQSVQDICALIHKDFIEKLRFARLWRGNSAPITVSRNEPVHDGDILELHI